MCIFYANGGSVHPLNGDFCSAILDFGFRYLYLHTAPPGSSGGRVKTMRIGLKIFAAVVLLLAAGCGGDGKGPEEEQPVCDGWMLTRWDGSGELSGTVYLQLKEDYRFNLYQSILNYGFRKLTGSYSVSGDGTVLSGTYAGGTPWKSSYTIEKRTGKELRLRSVPEGVVSVYTAVVVPAYVKNNVTDRDSRAAGEPFL